MGEKMKTLTTLLLLIITTSAFAWVNVDSTWEEIEKAPYLHARFYQIPVNVGLGTTLLRANSFCLMSDGETLKTNNQHEICDESTMRRNGRNRRRRVCLESHVDYIYTTVDYKRKKCIKWRGPRSNRNCQTYAYVDATRPLDFTVGVYKKNNRSRLAFRKEYSIPSCE